MTWLRRHFLSRTKGLMVALCLVVGLGGCARPGHQPALAGASASSSATSEAEAQVPFDASIDWDDPIEGIPTTVPLAQQLLQFQVLTPSGLGDPIGTYVTPLTVAPGDRVIEFVYDSVAYGRVVVEEHLPDVPADGYDADNAFRISLNGSPDLHGHYELRTIREGAQALITYSENNAHSELRWLQDGQFEVIVRGPTLDGAQCIQIAEAL